MLDFDQAVADTMDSQFVSIDGKNVIPNNIGKHRQQTTDLSYEQLPCSTGAIYLPNNPYIADPDLVQNNDFPRLSEINPSGKEEIVPLVQTACYFAFQLDSDAH